MTLVHAEVEKNIRNVAAAKRNVPKVFFLLFSGLSENLNIYNHLEIVSRVFFRNIAASSTAMAFRAYWAVLLS